MQSSCSGKTLYLQTFAKSATCKPYASTEINHRRSKRFASKVCIVSRGRLAIRLKMNRKGVADAQLAKKEEERGRKRQVEVNDQMNGSRKRSRSMSSYSSISVSTISTNISDSPSPKLTSKGHTGQSQLLSKLEVDRKRRRSSSPSIPYSAGSSLDGKEREHLRNPGLNRPGRKRPMAGARSHISTSPMDQGRTQTSRSEDYTKRRRYSSRSPSDRGRGRESYPRRGSRRTSSNGSRDRSKVVRNRKSMTPGLSATQLPRNGQKGGKPENDLFCDRRQSYSKDHDRYGSSARDRDRNENIRGSRAPRDSLPQREERSLSPFSKRLALTMLLSTEKKEV